MGGNDNETGYRDSLRTGARFIQTDRLDLLVPWLAERGVLVECAPKRDLTCLGDQPNGAVRVAAAGR